MPTGLHKLIALIRQTGEGLSDDRLLARFVVDRDEDAFAALVRRHGPMVWGVCRRVLGDHHDAEDAFQAAFLVLAQKAAAVRPGAPLAPWLYGVAHKVALKAAAAVKRRSREVQVKDMPQPEVAPAEVPDWRPLLDRELARLSERYRAAVVLCDLQGHSRKEAARRLGVPERTLASRLARAHAQLARRLRGRGVALPGAALAMSLAADAAATQVPAALLRSTARVAALVAAGQLAGASSAPFVLMKGVMQAMLMKKLRLAVLGAAVVAALGAVGLASRTGEEVRAQDASPPAARAGKKPANEVEALRRENEDLRGTVRVLLKEIRTLQKSLEDARPRPGAAGGNRPALGGPTTPRPQPGAAPVPAPKGSLNQERNSYKPYKLSPDAQPKTAGVPGADNAPEMSPDVQPKTAGVPGADNVPETRANPGATGAAREVEAALNAFRQARDPEGRRRAAEALGRATQRIRERYAPPTAEKKP